MLSAREVFQINANINTSTLLLIYDQKPRVTIITLCSGIGMVVGDISCSPPGMNKQTDLASCVMNILRNP